MLPCTTIRAPIGKGRRAHQEQGAVATDYFCRVTFPLEASN